MSLKMTDSTIIKTEKMEKAEQTEKIEQAEQTTSKDLEDILKKVQLPYDVTKLGKDELGILEEKFNGLSDEDKIKVVGIAGEIFDDRYEMPDVKDGRWYLCLMYGVVEFSQQKYKKQACETASA